MEKFDLTQIHHVNLLVRDLDLAKERYRALFNIDFIDEALPSRGIITSRFQAGGSWVVLVQPVAEGVPMTHLREHGEGLFLLSLGVEQSESNGPNLSAVRDGIAGWRVADTDLSKASGATVQVAFVHSD